MKRSLPFQKLLVDVPEGSTTPGDISPSCQHKAAVAPAKSADGVPLSAGNPDAQQLTRGAEISSLLELLEQARAAQDAGRRAQVCSQLAMEYMAQGDWLQAQQYSQLAIAAELTLGDVRPTAALGLLHRFANWLCLDANAGQLSTNHTHWEEFELSVADQFRCGDVTEAVERLELAAEYSARRGDRCRSLRYRRLAQRLRVGAAVLEGNPHWN